VFSSVRDPSDASASEAVERWLAKFGHGYKWKPCLKAAMMPRIRSEHGKTSETNA
jgi:hypothetical protein